MFMENFICKKKSIIRNLKTLKKSMFIYMLCYKESVHEKNCTIINIKISINFPFWLYCCCCCCMLKDTLLCYSIGG